MQDYRVQEYRLPSPPSIKCNVPRESLSKNSQNIPCATFKKRGSWGNLYISLDGMDSSRTKGVLNLTIDRAMKTALTRVPDPEPDPDP